MLARAHKKFQREQYSEIYLLTLKEQDKTKMELPLDMVSKHGFWYPYLQDYDLMLITSVQASAFKHNKIRTHFCRTIVKTAKNDSFISFQ